MPGFSLPSPELWCHTRDRKEECLRGKTRTPTNAWMRFRAAMVLLPGMAKDDFQAGFGKETKHTQLSYKLY